MFYDQTNSQILSFIFYLFWTTWTHTGSHHLQCGPFEWPHVKKCMTNIFRLIKKKIVACFKHFNITFSIVIGVKSFSNISDISYIDVISFSDLTHRDKAHFSAQYSTASFPLSAGLPVQTATLPTCAVHPCTAPKFFSELTSGLSLLIALLRLSLPARALTSAGLLLLTVPAE